MGLFGNNEEKAKDVEIEIKTTKNSWLREGTPKAIVRNLPNGGDAHTFEYFKAKGCNTMYPCIQVKDCVKIVETDQTFEVLPKYASWKVVPKSQVIEIQYYKEEK